MTATLASILNCTSGTHHALVPVLFSTGIENLMVLKQYYERPETIHRYGLDIHRPMKIIFLGYSYICIEI